MSEAIKPDATAEEWLEQTEVAAQKMGVSADQAMAYDPSTLVLVGAIGGTLVKAFGDKIVKALPGPWGTLGQLAMSFLKKKGKKQEEA